MSHERLYMPNIYTPNLHNELHTVGLLNVIRELNFKYGLKVATPLADFGCAFDLPHKHKSVMLSYGSGFNCAVIGWDFTEKTFRLFTPFFTKKRGTDDKDRSTVSAKSIKRLIGLIDKYDAIKSENHFITKSTAMLLNLLNEAQNSVRLNRHKLAYNLEDNQIVDIARFAAPHLLIDPSEIPNGQATMSIDRLREEVQSILKEAKVREQAENKQRERVKELINPEALLIGMYSMSLPNTTDDFANARYRITNEHVAVACIAEEIPNAQKENRFIIKRPFEPIYDFEDLIDKFPEAMPQLVATKLRTEETNSSSRDDIFMSLTPRADSYDENIPYATFFYSVNRFNHQWFVTPIKR